jgi:hypothetical protein
VRIQLAALLLLAASTTPGLSKDTPPPPAPVPAVCYLAGMAFSPGVYIRTGDTVSLCRADGTWRAAEGTVAGCLRDGHLFSVGGSAALGDDKGTTQVCGKDGVWS